MEMSTLVFSELIERGIVEAMGRRLCFKPQHPKSMRWKLEKVKGIINSVLSEFICIFPKWDFLLGDPRVTNPWGAEKEDDKEIENI